jgi:hypothetical protein
MAKRLGQFIFPANFQVKSAEALDPRMVAENKAALLVKDNWPHDGDIVYIYKGIIVDCGEDGVYRYICNSEDYFDISQVSNELNWERIDAKGVVGTITGLFQYKGSVATRAALNSLNPSVGDVYNVEEEVTETTTTELGDSITKTYLGGTNWAWTGSKWDALAGSIDLSVFASKLYVEQALGEISTNISTNATNIKGLGSTLEKQVGILSANIAKKVDAEEGKSLVSNDKITLIDTNASKINTLEGQQSLLDGRVTTLEGFFEGDDGQGGTLNLSGITSQLTTLRTDVSNLQNDKANKSELTALIGRVTAVEEVNNTQATALTTLDTNVGKLSTDVEGLRTLASANNTKLGTLEGTVNEHTTKLSSLETQIGGIGIKSVNNSDSLLSVENGVISSEIDFVREGNKIVLKGRNGEINSIDCTDFIKDGMIDSVSYNSSTKDMTITWNSASGKTSTSFSLADLVDTYNAGSGLVSVGNTFSVKLDSSANNKLTISNNGLLVDITQDLASTLGVAKSYVDNKIEDSFKWNDITE